MQDVMWCHTGNNNNIIIQVTKRSVIMPVHNVINIHVDGIGLDVVNDILVVFIFGKKKLKIFEIISISHYLG